MSSRTSDPTPTGGSMLQLCATLVHLEPGSKVLRNAAIDAAGLSRRRGCRELLKIFSEKTEDPFALYIQSLNIRMEVGADGKSYFIRDGVNI